MVVACSDRHAALVLPWRNVASRRGQGLSGAGQIFRDEQGKEVLFSGDNPCRFTQANSEMSALLGRMPAALVTTLASGTVTVRKEGGAEEQYGVSGGFFEVSNNRATLLADSVGTAAG